MNKLQIAALLALTPLVTRELEAAQQSVPLTQTAPLPSGSSSSSSSHEHGQKLTTAQVEKLFAQKLFETGRAHERNARAIPQEQAVAFLYMQEAAKRGDTNAQCVLSNYYQTNTGIPVSMSEKDRLAKAFEYAKLSAEQNLPAAQHALGLCYENGIDTEGPNPEKALEWYKKAAALHDQNAQAGIKRCIEKLQKMLVELQAPLPAPQLTFPPVQVSHADDRASSASSSSSSSSGASSLSPALQERTFSPLPAAVSVSSAQQAEASRTLLSRQEEEATRTQAMEIEAPKAPQERPLQQTAAVSILSVLTNGTRPASTPSTTNTQNPWVVHEIVKELYDALGRNKKITASILGLQQTTLDCCLEGRENDVSDGTAYKVIAVFEIARREQELATAWRLKAPVIKRLCTLLDDARATTPPNSPTHAHAPQHSSGITDKLVGSPMSVPTTMEQHLSHLFLINRSTKATHVYRQEQPAPSSSSSAGSSSAIAEAEHEGKQEKMASEIAAQEQQSQIAEHIPASAASLLSSSAPALAILVQTPKQQFAQELLETGKKLLYETEEDLQIALEHLKLAAENESIEALFELGEYFNLINDSAQALHYFRLAAEQNHAVAQCRLADFYEKGIGVTANLDQTIAWYMKAAGQGHRQAKEELKRCNATLQTMLAEIVQLLQSAPGEASSSSSPLASASSSSLNIGANS